jgi:hypothetical protein
MLRVCFYACACQVHDCAFFVSIIDDRFASQVLFFQDALIFQSVIPLCYNTQFVAFTILCIVSKNTGCM